MSSGTESDRDSQDSVDDESGDENSPNGEIYTGNEEIQVDFEGRSPLDCDFDGIKQLLLQLFLNGKVNLNELSEIIIGQNHIGSVLSQCLDGPAVPEPKKKDAHNEDEEEDSDDDEDDDNMIFGLTSVINLANPQEKESVKQLGKYFVDKCEDRELAEKLTNLLADTENPTGFIINERFINIPPQIAVPMLENLEKEIRKAADKKMPYRFARYLMMIKFYRSEKKAKKPQSKKDQKNRNKPTVVHYSNPEEEIFDKNLLLSYEFSVATDADTGLTGNWLEEDKALTPFRRVIVFDSQNLPKMIETIKEFID